MKRKWREEAQDGVLEGAPLPKAATNGPPPSQRFPHKLPSSNISTCCACLLDLTKDDCNCLINCCLHQFHEECLNEWAKKDTRCPMCRSAFERGAFYNKGKRYKTVKFKKASFIDCLSDEESSDGGESLQPRPTSATQRLTPQQLRLREQRIAMLKRLKEAKRECCDPEKAKRSIDRYFAKLGGIKCESTVYVAQTRQRSTTIDFKKFASSSP